MPITKAQIWRFVRLHGQLVSMSSVFGTLHTADSTVANTAISSLSTSVVNLLLEEANAFLGADSPLQSALDVPLAAAPSHGEVLLLVGQLLAALNAFKAANVILRHGRWYWLVEKDGAPNEVDYLLVDPQAGTKEESG